jgi:hypothetical protein
LGIAAFLFAEYICKGSLIKKIVDMKKVLMLATAAFLISGFAFAGNGGEKGKAKGKKCCKGGKCCKDKDKKDGKTAKM